MNSHFCSINALIDIRKRNIRWVSTMFTIITAKANTPHYYWSYASQLSRDLCAVINGPLDINITNRIKRFVFRKFKIEIISSLGQLLTRIVAPISGHFMFDQKILVLETLFVCFGWL